MVACTSVVASTAVMLLAFARGSFGHKTKFTLADDVDGVKGTATWDILPLDAPTGHLIKDARASNVSTHGLFSYRFSGSYVCDVEPHLYKRCIERDLLTNICTGDFSFVRGSGVLRQLAPFVCSRFDRCRR